ncbi:hypothetical protein AGDE_01166 [Angomonas deanei]|nr:hypothetical protein AGDE_01166 [Angomonas deanei]|eukprot:EPY42757.1 hypothetical protein AGDE_01166 [Angomonas deanei]
MRRCARPTHALALGVVSPLAVPEGDATLTTARRHRFYKPLVNSGINLWRARMGRLHKGWDTWQYQHTKPDPRPYPEPAVNNYYGRSRIWNPIAGKIGLVNKKIEEWDWPKRRPPPTGLRHSPEYFPYFFDKYFPDVEVSLVLDSVLNNETTRPVFTIPQDMSKQELANYLKNIYNIDNIAQIGVRNVRGKRFKNEVGTIKSHPDYKTAVVELDSPVVVEFKHIKGTEDTPDNQPQAQIS